MIQLTSTLMARMRADIRLAIVTLYCVCAVALISPFGIYRLLAGEILIGITDLGIVATFVALTLLAWKPGKTSIAADLTACSATLAVIAVVYLLELSILWTFSTLVGNFLMARLPVAVSASAVLVASVGLNASGFGSTTEQMTFLAVATLVSLFGLIFASRVERQHVRLSHMAAHDGLTGALNRRTMDHDLESLIMQRSDSSQKHCLAILDLDNFKSLNDRFGHGLGDQILIDLTRIVEVNTREKDRFYRYGGEEFVLLLPRTTLIGAQVALGNLRQAMAASLVAPDAKVTASFGLAEHRPGETVEDWLKRADQALLQAKLSGKDCVFTAD